MTSVKPKKRVFRTPKQLLQWVLKSLNAHISKYWFSQNGAFVWLAWVVPGLLGVFLSVFECFWVFLSVFECFWVFLSVFECFWVKKKKIELFWRASNGSWPKKKTGLCRFLTQKQHGPNHSGDHFWTFGSILEYEWRLWSPKNVQNSFYTGFWNR